MKILASNFDNTIYLSGEDDLNQNNIAAIRRFVSYGNIFIIMTDKNYTDLKQTLTRYNIPHSYLICEEGAKIFNNVDYGINTINLEKQEIEKMIAILEEENCNYYLDDGYNETKYTNDCVKITINYTDEKEIKRIIDRIKENTKVHISQNKNQVNITHHTANKQFALKTLMNIEDLDYNQLYVIGESENDYEMLKSFEGVILKEHHPLLNELNKKEVNSIADYIEELMKN